ncbi:Uncharacterised protein [Bacillus freudenreichii]|nr:Uncharacterised protein [Bacillus freudenreichii]
MQMDYPTQKSVQVVHMVTHLQICSDRSTNIKQRAGYVSVYQPIRF